MRFQDKVVAVTGAGRGIGWEIARGFAAEGAVVAILDVSQEGAEAGAKAVRDSVSGARVAGFSCDVSQSAQVESAFAQIAKDLGAVSILVNNAGITRDTLLIRMSEDDWDKVLTINLKGAFLCTKAVVRDMMKARFGRIINMASIVGMSGAAGQANYAASKGGLIAFSKAVAKELGSRGITCNAVAPGFIETVMTAELPTEMRENVLKTAPLGRLGSPADVAAAVLFLASDEAGYVTGQVIPVDGGLAV